MIHEPAPSKGTMKIQPNSRLLMIGDSITDVDRARPIGEGNADALGKGYVSFIDGIINAVRPEMRIRITNMGTGGHTVRDLAARWQNDVINLKPDWVSVMIGINDVWRQFDRPLLKEAAVLPEEYESALDGLMKQTRPLVKGLVMITPYYIEPNKADPMRAQMDRYGQIVKKLAEKHGAIFVDTQAAFDNVMKTIYPAELAWDRVHPGRAGHILIAMAFLKAVGFTF